MVVWLWILEIFNISLPLSLIPKINFYGFLIDPDSAWWDTSIHSSSYKILWWTFEMSVLAFIGQLQTLVLIGLRPCPIWSIWSIWSQCSDLIKLCLRLHLVSSADTPSFKWQIKAVLQGVPKKRTFTMLLEPQCTGSITICRHPLCLEIDFLVVSC